LCANLNYVKECGPDLEQHSNDKSRKDKWRRGRSGVREKDDWSVNKLENDVKEWFRNDGIKRQSWFETVGMI
jgi:hypothetical protein